MRLRGRHLRSTIRNFKTETLVSTAMAGAAARTLQCIRICKMWSEMLKVIAENYQHSRKVAVKMGVAGGWAFDGSNDNGFAHGSLPTRVMNWNTTTHHCHE